MREFVHDDDLVRSWSVYQHVRTVARNKPADTFLSPDKHLQLFERISAAVVAEDTHAETPVSSVPVVHTRTRWAAGSLAIAATLVIGVYIGSAGVGTLNPQSDPVQTASLTPQDPSQGSSQSSSQGTAITNRVQYPQMAANQLEGADSDLSELVELDEEKQKLLRAYLNQHDRMARMNDNTSLVNFKNGSRN